MRTIKTLCLMISVVALGLAGCVPPGGLTTGKSRTHVQHNFNLAAGQLHEIDLQLVGPGMISVDCMAWGNRGKSVRYLMALNGPGNRGSKKGHYALFRGSEPCAEQYYVSDDDLRWGYGWKVVVKNLEHFPINARVNIRYPGYQYAHQEPGYSPPHEDIGRYTPPPVAVVPQVAPKPVVRQPHQPRPAARHHAAHQPRPAARHHTAKPAKRHYREHEVVAAKSRVHPVKPAKRKSTWINRKFTLSASFGNRQLVQFRLERPGRVILDSTWQNGNIPLAMMLNGPGQTSAYTRKDGRSRSRVELVVTPTLFAKGHTWTATIANFSRKGPVSGVFKIGYPGKR